MFTFLLLELNKVFKTSWNSLEIKCEKLQTHGELKEDDAQCGD